MNQTIPQLKRKLRQLKRLEDRIRFGNRPVPEDRIRVWDRFFSTRNDRDGSVQYPLHDLVKMDKQTLKSIFAAYFYGVYYQSYRENGLIPKDLFDPSLLSLLDLPPDAGPQDVKDTFRRLAKRYHPDHGGDSKRFIELMDTYRKLKGI